MERGDNSDHSKQHTDSTQDEDGNKHSGEHPDADAVETRLGNLKFVDRLPDKATVEKVYDNLDFIRGVDVFLNTISAASLRANIEGLKSVGGNHETPVIHEQRVDARTLLLTPNTQTASLWSWLETWRPGDIELLG